MGRPEDHRPSNTSLTWQYPYEHHHTIPCLSPSLLGKEHTWLLSKGVTISPMPGMPPALPHRSTLAHWELRVTASPEEESFSWGPQPLTGAFLFLFLSLLLPPPALPPALSQCFKQRSMDHPSPQTTLTPALITQLCCSWVVFFFFSRLPHQPCGQGPCLIHLGHSEQGLAWESCPQAAELAVGTDKQDHSVLLPEHPFLCWKMQHSAWLTWGWSQHSEDMESLGHLTNCPLLSGNTPCLWPDQCFLSCSSLARPFQCPLHTTKVAFPDCCDPAMGRSQQRWLQGEVLP